ncbi:hypothetical protein CB1_002578016 [Camelus ferus]|nr:hypothetical protein CB1_002578016 [Camelus ferus]
MCIPLQLENNVNTNWGNSDNKDEKPFIIDDLEFHVKKLRFYAVGNGKPKWCCHWRLLAPLNRIICLDIINVQIKPVPLACQEITVENKTGRRPTQDKCGIPVVDPFLREGSERDTNVFLPSLGALMVGGRATPAVSWPWLVSLQHQGQRYCGDALIGRRRVLTAAHGNFRNVSEWGVAGDKELSEGPRGSETVDIVAQCPMAT